MAGEIIHTDNAPSAVGPYVQGRRVGNYVYTSGQIPFVPSTMLLVGDDIESQTLQSLKNMLAVVEAGGAKKEDIVKATLFIRDMNHFPRINQVYADFFGDYKPARSCVEVSRLPKDVYIEIECFAHID